MSPIMYIIWLCAFAAMLRFPFELQLTTVKVNQIVCEMHNVGEMGPCHILADNVLEGDAQMLLVHVMARNNGHIRKHVATLKDFVAASALEPLGGQVLAHCRCGRH